MFNRLAKGINIIGIDRHDVPMLVGIKVTNGQFLHTGKQLISQTSKRVLRNRRHNQGKAIVSKYPDQTDQTNPCQEGQERSKIMAVGR